MIACNDTLQAYAGTLHFGEESLSGAKAWDRRIDVQIPENASLVLAEVNTAEFSASKDAILFAQLSGDAVRSDVFFPNFWKEVPWPDPELCIESIKTKAPGIVDVTVRANKFARCVHFEGIHEGYGAVPSVFVEDMFFDLRAGEIANYGFIALQHWLRSEAEFSTDSLSLQHWLTDWGAATTAALNGWPELVGSLVLYD